MFLELPISSILLETDASEFEIQEIYQKASEIKSELSKFKKIASTIEEGYTPLLKLNTSESWNFLYEDKDFEISILGDIKFIQ